MESKLWVRTNGRMEIERKTKRFDNPSKHKSNGGYTMKKFVSKLFACLLVVVIAASIMCSSAFALYAPCKKDGCYKMRVAGSFFCERHRDNYYAPNDEPKKPEPVKTNTIYCAKSGCTRLHSTYSKYCIYHRPESKLVDSDSSTSKSYSYSTKSSKSSSSKTSSKKSYNSYDDGYDDVYDNDDYDWDRYNSDSDYADGVDDAMDELDW